MMRLRRRMVVVGEKGLFRELNPGPLVPETRIILLDQTANTSIVSGRFIYLLSLGWDGLLGIVGCYVKWLENR